MYRLTQAPNLALAQLWVDALQAHGVEAQVQREYLAAVVGQLPPDQCLPEIWIADSAQLAVASDLLQRLQHPPQYEWACACGEKVEGGFDLCWHCANARPDWVRPRP